VISIEGLSKTYAGASAKAVDSLDLAVRDGEIFGFLGPNGAGKTTTLKLITGSLAPDGGRVEIDGIDLCRRPLEAKRRFGFVGDDPELFGRLRAREYLAFVADVYGVPDSERRKRIAELAGRFSIAENLDLPIAALSRGMKQKVCLVASLVHDPGNWLLDEPMVGLDPQAAFDLKELMRERRARGRCVLFSTHILEVAERLCDRIAVMDRGRLAFVGTVEELRASRGGDAEGRSLERLFLDLVDGGPGGAE
jgi:ABC-2 type transport system ATP-binding protein